MNTKPIKFNCVREIFQQMGELTFTQLQDEMYNRYKLTVSKDLYKTVRRYLFGNRENSCLQTALIITVAEKGTPFLFNLASLTELCWLRYPELFSFEGVEGDIYPDTKKVADILYGKRGKLYFDNTGDGYYQLSENGKAGYKYVMEESVKSNVQPRYLKIEHFVKRPGGRPRKRNPVSSRSEHLTFISKNIAWIKYKKGDLRLIEFDDVLPIYSYIMEKMDRADMRDSLTTFMALIDTELTETNSNRLVLNFLHFVQSQFLARYLRYIKNVENQNKDN